MKKIFLTGSTGLLGQKFLDEISKEDLDIVLGKRTVAHSKDKFKCEYFNLEDKSLELNLENIDTVVHLASNTSDLSSNSDIVGIELLLKSIEKYKIKHLVFISIIGVDKVPIKYFKTKYKVEQMIKEECPNYTILRSTQFFEFFEKEIQKQLKGKIRMVPNLKYQPIETRIVAEHLIEICKGKNLNSIIEIGGSEIILFKDAIKEYQKTIGNNSIIPGIPNFLLGKFGDSLTTKNRIHRSKTWAEYLKAKND